MANSPNGNPPTPGLKIFTERNGRDGVRADVESVKSMSEINSRQNGRDGVVIGGGRSRFSFWKSIGAIVVAVIAGMLLWVFGMN